MEKKDVIKRFSSKRPDAIGVYGYGSGVFKQVSNNQEQAQNDVIFVVNDIGKWHQMNMADNPGDYSFIGRLHFGQGNIDKVKGKNGITYFSNIKDQGLRFKYGVIEIHDFLLSLATWENMFVAGRFQKPVLNVMSYEYIDEVIEYNRRSALLVACLFCDMITSEMDIYNTLCKLSYLGDARMRIAENPNKVKNIVTGSFEELKRIYPLNQDFLVKLDCDRYIVRYDLILEQIDNLPQALLDYLKSVETDFNDLESVRINIFTYLMTRNKEESKSQILEGVKTNGVLRSVPYVLAKVKKRFQHR